MLSMNEDAPIGINADVMKRILEKREEENMNYSNTLYML